MMGYALYKAASVFTTVVTIRNTWMTSNAMPDSISTNVIRRSVLPPVIPKIWSSEVVLTRRNTLRILNTINDVIAAFTAIDMERPAMKPTLKRYSQYATGTTKLEAYAIQQARGNLLKLAGVKWRIGSDLTDLSMRILRLMEQLRHGCCDPTRANIGKSLKRLDGYDNKDRHLCALEQIGQLSHSNQMLRYGWLG